MDKKEALHLAALLLAPSVDTSRKGYQEVAKDLFAMARAVWRENSDIDSWDFSD
jgi:hypothetical protein